MRPAILVFIVASLMCGFALPETVAQRKAREAEAKAWLQTISSRYDRDALLKFLSQTVADVKNWKDVSLAKPRIGTEWKVVGRGMTCGDWSFSASEPAKDDFVLSFIYRTDRGERWLMMKCARDDKTRFHVVGIESEEVVILML